MRVLGYFLISGIVTLQFCAPRTSPSTGSGSQSKEYQEDLSVWREKFALNDSSNQLSPENNPNNPVERTEYVEAKFAVNEQVDAILDSIAEVNLMNNHVDGFTIQIYSGVKREEALNAKKEMALQIPELEADIQYAQPNFRVRVGKYFDRFDAQRDYMTIKKRFPNAIIIPERIPIK